MEYYRQLASHNISMASISSISLENHLNCTSSDCLLFRERSNLKTSNMSTRPARSITPTQSRHSQTGRPGSRSSEEKEENVKTKGWVREVLRKYLAKYVRDFLSQRKDIVPSPVTSRINLSVGGAGEGTSASYTGDDDHDGDLEILHSDILDHTHTGGSTSRPDKGKKLAEKNLKMGLTISDLTMTEETALGDDRITYLSRIKSLGVKYSVGGRPDHFVHWIVKLPSSRFDERNLARLTNVHSREVNFYANILQHIKLWLEFNTPALSDSEDNQCITLNVPTCYYAYSQGSSNFDIDSETESFPNHEFTLILEDLRTQGFGKRHFSNGLTLEEAFEALREIAKFHATCWSMGEHSDASLLECWSALLKWEDLYSLYLDMVRQGFRHLHRFRRDYITERTLAELVDSLLILESKLPVILQNLLRPLPPPAVTTLVHMDLWTDNLLFRDDNPGSGVVAAEKESSHSENPSTSSAAYEGGESRFHRDVDCMILDWQMVSLGRISHDLGILMMTSLDGSVRRDHGMLLLKFYFETFEKIANSFKLEIPFDLSDLVAQYKDSCLLATLLSVSRLDLVVSEQSTLQRFFEALEDLRDEQLI